MIRITRDYYTGESATDRYPALKASIVDGVASRFWYTPNPSKGISYPEDSLTVELRVRGAIIAGVLRALAVVIDLAGAGRPLIGRSAREAIQCRRI